MKFLLPLLLMAVGEGVMIYAELIAARAKDQISSVLLWCISLAVMGAIALIFAYILGYRTFQNIWIVAAISITSILVIEPILAYAMFHEVPTKGALLGLIFGAVGLVVSLVY